MATTVVDSDFLIDVLRGVPGRAAALAEFAVDTTLATTTVSMFELLRGARTEDARRRVLELVADFEIFDFDLPGAAAAADIWVETRAAGTPVETGDILIAGIVRAHSLVLMTRNLRDFEHINGIELATI